MASEHDDTAYTEIRSTIDGIVLSRDVEPGEVRAALERLTERFGKAGVWYHSIARGIDLRAVRPDRERKSVGAEETFAQDLHDFEALAGELDTVAYKTDPVFNLEVPQSVPGVPTEVLTPRDTWRDTAAYDEQARKLAQMFIENFKGFEADAAPEVRNAGPRQG